MWILPRSGWTVWAKRAIIDRQDHRPGPLTRANVALGGCGDCRDAEGGREPPWCQLRRRGGVDRLVRQSDTMCLIVSLRSLAEHSLSTTVCATIPAVPARRAPACYVQALRPTRQTFTETLLRCLDYRDGQAHTVGTVRHSHRWETVTMTMLHEISGDGPVDGSQGIWLDDCAE